MGTAVIDAPRWKLREIERQRKKVFEKRMEKLRKLRDAEARKLESEQAKRAAHNTLLIRVRGVEAPEKTEGVLGRLGKRVVGLFGRKTKQK